MAGRPKKVVDETTIENKETEIVEKETKTENDELKKVTEEKNAMAEMMKQMQEQMKAMQEQIENTKTEPIVIKQENGLGGRKIKCINLMHNPVNISTEPNGGGRVYTFDKYGESRLIKFDELSDIVASYPNTMESGCVYICSPEVVETFGLTDTYENLYTKEMLDELVYLRRESDVDLFLGMNKAMQESNVLEIARLLSQNEFMDRNFLARIKKESGYDIEKLAEDISAENKKKSDLKDEEE